MPGDLIPKVSIFISYHHDEDQQYFDEIVRLYSNTYDIVRDNPAERREDGNNPQVIIQRIRENYINSAVCTLVLCGSFTRWRKYVDYEIKATLESRRGLIGINLPSNPPTATGYVNLPERLNDNIHTGYALWVSWENIISSPETLRRYIDKAITRRPRLIRNKRPVRY